MRPIHRCLRDLNSIVILYDWCSGGYDHRCWFWITWEADDAPEPHKAEDEGNNTKLIVICIVATAAYNHWGWLNNDRLLPRRHQQWLLRIQWSLIGISSHRNIWLTRLSIGNMLLVETWLLDRLLLIILLLTSSSSRSLISWLLNLLMRELANWGTGANLFVLLLF